MVDVDGVVSLFGATVASALRPSAPAPADSPDEVRGTAGSFHSIDGIPHFLSSTAAAHLHTLSGFFELVWASGWEEKANEHLPHLLGLPSGLPFLRFPRSPGRSHAHWKLESIDTYARGRPVAWIDDSFNPACHAWADARRAPTLLVSTAPELGLGAREAELLAGWAAELPES